MTGFHCRQVRGHQNLDATDVLPTGDRSGRTRKAEAGRPRGRQQGFLPRPGRAPRRIRLEGQGHGGMRHEFCRRELHNVVKDTTLVELYLEFQ